MHTCALSNPAFDIFRPPTASLLEAAAPASPTASADSATAGARRSIKFSNVARSGSSSAPGGGWMWEQVNCMEEDAPWMVAALQNGSVVLVMNGSFDHQNVRGYFSRTSLQKTKYFHIPSRTFSVSWRL